MLLPESTHWLDVAVDAMLIVPEPLVMLMPAPADILSGKVTTLDVKEISAMYALTTGLCYELKAASDDKTVPTQKMNEMVDNFLEYVMANFETELIVMGCKLLMKTYKIRFDQFSVKALVPFHKKYGKFVLESV
jgi:hypothetical protein